MEKKRDVTIYTDGCCLGNPGPGGYGVVLLAGERRKELSGGYRLTTNNRMEMMAAIVALQTLKMECAVTLHSDSSYLINGFNKGWIVQWRKNGWKKADKKPVLNVDLWEKLVALNERHEVRFVWVRGHAGNRENERCDTLSKQAAQGRDLLVDDEYEKVARG